MKKNLKNTINDKRVSNMKNNNNNNDESRASKIIRMIRARQSEEGDSFQFPEGGDHSIRDMLSSLEVDQEELINHPLYKEGYDDGYRKGKYDADEQARALVNTIVNLYS